MDGTKDSSLNIYIKAQSQATKWPIEVSAIPPVITIGSQNITPSVPPTSPVGYQAVILADPRYSSQTILFNGYFNLDVSQSWYNNYRKMYDTMLNEISCSQYSVQNNVLILCSFGIGNNIPPTASMYEYLLTNGSGSNLTYWENHCDPGSQMSNPDWWMVLPVNYILVGRFGSGPVGSYEKYERSPDWYGQIVTELVCSI